MLLLDLTGFKQINDQHGHDAGDDVLRAVADRLATATTGAVAGRLGGDEFVLLLPKSTTPGRLFRPDNSVTARIQAGEEGRQVAVSCVVGAARPGVGVDRLRPFRTADIALYHARHHRLPWALYNAGMTHPGAAVRYGHPPA